jgi:hypothetical protein
MEKRKASYDEIIQAVGEVNLLLGLNQKTQNVSKKHLVLFLNTAFKKYNDKMSEKCFDICDRLPDPDSCLNRDDACPSFGRWIEECGKLCDHTERCKFFTDTPDSGNYTPELEVITCPTCGLPSNLGRSVTIPKPVPITLKDHTNPKGEVETLNLMYDLMSSEPDQTRDSFRTKIDSYGVKYQEESFQGAWRRVRKVISFLRKHGYVI